MRRILLPLIICLLLPASGIAQPDNWKLVREKTEAKLREITVSTRGCIGLSAVDLTSGERFDLNENFLFPQASAIKIPILMEVFKQAHEGKFNLSDMRWVEKVDKVGGGGILQELGDHSSELSIRDLCVLMILLSDNTATNMLIDLVGMDRINATMKQLGLKKTRVQRKMLDQAASGRGDENLSTPAEASRILEILYKGEFLNRAACDEMLSILKKPKPGAIKSGVPDDVSVAFKPGGIAGVTTEWAVVFLRERPYIIVIMENYGLEKEASSAMTSVSRVIYNYFWRLGRATPYGTYVEPPSGK